MEDKLDIILESLNRIEKRLKKLECHCKDNEPNFIREVGANILGDYIFTVMDNNWIRRGK
jgi:hypothetical protein